MAPRKIIIDTDPGQDDAVAILLALAFYVEGEGASEGSGTVLVLQVRSDQPINQAEVISVARGALAVAAEG